ncbi:hypothetical protein [Methylobacterium sp. J-070]|uniref:hypothetical protein n=1 Tax=Methylobacterium sp. J-070 TaxID=2836650 RepID=UPI001FBA81E1|nr:hypothetical protein [Methylobacterium sp. J-070]MCJ2054453.1 hypothetical protein [Methylobacterium sp. J-070]
MLQYQGLVEDEILSHRDLLADLTGRGLIIHISGAEVFASEVGAIADKYNVGLGEAECIAIGLKSGCAVASDDRKARIAAETELGRSRIIGSIGLLAESVAAGVILPADAYTSYSIMKAKGAHLPRLSEDYFV